MTATLTCRASKPGAELRLSEKVLDLGAIDNGDSATDSVKIYNDGSEPLVITSIFTDCNCTVTAFTKRPIEPGDSGAINVTFKTRGREPGNFRKAVRIRSNSVNGTMILFVKGRIKRRYVK